MKNFQIRVYGRVQGVGFRYHTKNTARSLGISGYVKNMPDESVLIEAEGEEPALSEFLNWCHHGPERAVVENIKINEMPVKNFSGFETRF